VGGLGNDLLNGGNGFDQFQFNTALGATNVDTIQGYIAADDVIVLDRTVFTAFAAAGTLSASAFNTGTTATDADDRIIHDTTTGALYYDADGSGSSSAAVQFATLTGVTGLINNTEFLII
jgi:Ca2+-binding RTX toxin-like protein